MTWRNRLRCVLVLAAIAAPALAVGAGVALLSPAPLWSLAAVVASLVAWNVALAIGVHVRLLRNGASEIEPILPPSNGDSTWPSSST